MTIAPQFRVVSGDSPRRLLDRFDRDAAAAPLSPFDDEVIIVQSLGMERWVRQQLAVRRGAAASLDMPFPAAFCRRLATTLQGAGLDPRFEEQALTWRLAALLDEPSALAGPEYAPLEAYLRNADAAKRYSLAQRIVARFDEYRLYRPDLLLAWERGEAGVPEQAAFAEHAAWQAALWRRLVSADRGAGRGPLHFARWFTATIDQLESAATAPANLPPRVAVFGISTLPPLFVRLLRALARFVPVTCYVLTPSASGWRTGDVRDPLEDAFGSTSRELLAELTEMGAPVEHLTTDLPAPAAPTLLARLQASLRRPAPLEAGAPRALIAPDDRSLLVHECHSPVRELEVLRDQLLDAFEADPSLRPHDVLVMVPDVETYAPLAAIVFGDPKAAADDERVAIPYRLADRALARDASAAQALSMLLDLAGSRFLASEVLDLLTLAPVQRAAGIAPSQLDQIAQWVRDAAIRWGRDGLDRGAHDLPSLEDFTWRQGLDRLLTGYAAGRVEALIEGVLPVAGDTIGEADLLGAFVEWTETLFARVDALREPRPLLEWSRTLQESLAWLVRPDGPDEQAAYDRVHRELTRLAGTAGDVLGEAATRLVPFEVARRWLGGALGRDQHDTGFLTGGLTLCAMKPMRAIPFKVIAILGLNDRAFPRRERRAAFDLIERDPRRGDRNPKADDRQLFLDTLLCAESRLILSWVGRSQKNNAEIAPSVVLSELLDLLDERFETERDDPARKPGEPRAPRNAARVHVLVPHALQPFNPLYFTGTDDRRFSFDQRWARAVQAAQHPAETPPFVTAPAPAPPIASTEPLVIDLGDLMDAWCNPARFHCLRVLQLRMPGEHDGVEDVEPSTVSGLERYAIHAEMLERHLRGDVDAARDRTLTVAAGQLPPGALGPVWYETLREQFDALAARIGSPVFADPLAVRVEGPGWLLTGRLDGQIDGAQLRVRAAKVRVPDEVRGWIAHLAYCAMGAQRPEAPGPTHVVGMEKDTGFAPVADAADLLAPLIAVYRRLLREPVPYFTEAGAAYWRAVDDPPRARERARVAYGTTTDFARADRDDPYVALLWRGREPLEECWRDFTELSETLWVPLSEAKAEYEQQRRAAARGAVEVEA